MSDMRVPKRYGSFALSDEERAHIKLWIKALRSGKYRQASTRLARRDIDGNVGYCCLGVACELYRKETGDGRWIENTGYFIFDDGTGDEDHNYLPRGVSKWLGTIAGNPVLFGNRTAAGLNDNGSSFKEIADIIEKTLDSMEDDDG